MLKATQSLFCVFTAISYLSKSFYEQFVLKKLDFEKILTALHARLQTVYTEVVNHLRKNSDSFVSICQLREFVVGKVRSLFALSSSGSADQDATAAEAALQRMLVTLLRSLTPEFLHYNIFLTQSSHNAFQNMMSNNGL